MKDPGKSEAKRQAEQKKGAEKGVWGKKSGQPLRFVDHVKGRMKQCNKSTNKLFFFAITFFKSLTLTYNFFFYKIGQC